VLRAPAALGRRPWSSAAARDRGKRERAAPGTDSQPQPGQGRSRVTWPRRPSANGRRRPWAGVQRRGGEQKGGEKHHGAPRIRLARSPRLGIARGWLSTAAGGAWRQWGWRWWPWGRRGGAERPFIGELRRWRCRRGRRAVCRAGHRWRCAGVVAAVPRQRRSAAWRKCERARLARYGCVRAA